MAVKTGSGRFALPPGWYDAGKDVALIYLPALSALYFGLSQIWGLPYGEQVVGTAALFSTALGTILKISSVSFSNSSKSVDGNLVVDQSDPTTDKFLIDVKTDLNEVAGKDTITLAVDNQTVTPPPVSSMDPRNVEKGTSQN